jgi:hypothetical protein
VLESLHCLHFSLQGQFWNCVASELRANWYFLRRYFLAQSDVAGNVFDAFLAVL